jgi:hypothetical protein
MSKLIYGVVIALCCVLVTVAFSFLWQTILPSGLSTAVSFFTGLFFGAVSQLLFYKTTR